jgi:hypothetical protein
MTLVDDPHPRKQTKLEEQMSIVEKNHQLKYDLNILIATHCETIFTNLQLQIMMMAIEIHQFFSAIKK